MMKYSRALSYLSSFFNFERHSGLPLEKRRFNLSRMIALLKRLDNPERGLGIVHIAGTNGKGSTAAYVASIAHQHDYKVGLYTSPHLIDIRERIQLNGVPISRVYFSKGMVRLKCAVEKFKWTRFMGKPTFFELLTAMAFWYFKERKVNLAVIEVGLGGRLDATNVIRPLVSIITSISHDHEYLLGYSLSSIAREKAAIIKEGIPVCVSPQKAVVSKVVRNRCRKMCSELIEPARGRSVRMRVDGVSFKTSINGKLGLEIKTPLSGLFQADNANLAICAYRLLHERYGFRFSVPNVRRGIDLTHWPGRFEVVQKKPLIILDGAHNIGAMESLAKSLMQLINPYRLRIIFGASKDKNIKAMLRILGRLKGQLYLVSSAHPRAMDVDELAELAKPFFNETRAFKRLSQALRFAREGLGKKDALLVTGSLFLVGKARRFLCPR